MSERAVPDKLFVPDAVRRVADRIAGAVGDCPEIKVGLGRTWRISLRRPDGRVFVWVDMKMTGGGRFRSAGSMLFIDGESVERARTLEHFSRIYAAADPWSQHGLGFPEPPDLTDETVVEIVDPDQMPAQVRREWSTLMDMMNSPEWLHQEVTTLVGQAGAHYIVQLVVGRVAVRRNFVTLMKLWDGDPDVVMNEDRPTSFYIDGVDRSDDDLVNDADEQVSRFVRFITGRYLPTTEQQSHGQVAKQSSPARMNSVEVRKATVRRV